MTLAPVIPHTPTFAGELCIVDSMTFSLYFLDAFENDERISANCSPFVAADNPRDTIFRLSVDGMSGYAVRPDGELVYVFSRLSGRGNALVRSAVADGATRLDCFDGRLVTLYSRFGFKIVRREANWSPSEPDVIFMTRPRFAGVTR